MPVISLQLRTRRPKDLGVTPGSTTLNRRGKELLRRVSNVVNQQLAAGDSDADYTVVYTAADPGFANTGLVLATASGAVGGTVNGVTVTTTASGGDTNTAGLIAAAINASTNALVQGFVTANNLTATLTLTSVTAGATVDICGTRFTATSGTPVNYVSGSALNTFDISGSDAADATALAAAINASPNLSNYIAAVPVSNVVRLFARRFSFSGTATFAWPSGPGIPLNTVLSNSGTIVASAASLAAGAFVALNACVPGVSGNAITIAASGTGMTVLNTETRLARGTGLGAVGISDNAGGGA